MILGWITLISTILYIIALITRLDKPWGTADKVMVLFLLAMWALPGSVQMINSGGQ